MIPLVRLPTPLRHQREVLEANARFKVVCAGRRWGKTLSGLIAVLVGHGPDRMFRGALFGKQGMWAGHVEKNTQNIWRLLKTATAGCWVEKSESERRIVFPGGGSITVRSAHLPDNLRGDGLDFLVLDEAAYMEEDAWTRVTRPMLSDRQGWGIFISTPRGQNWFWKRWQEARATPGWKRWQRPSSDNPIVTADELRKERMEMGSIAYAQEHDAEFVAPGGGLFKPEHARYYVREDLDGFWLARPEGEEEGYVDPKAMTRYVTVDTATSAKTSADFTAIAAWGLDPRGRLYLLDLDLRRIEGAKIMKQIQVMCARWNTIAWIEENSTSKHLLSFMDAQKVSYRTVNPGTTDKRTRALPASAMWERGGILLPKSLLARDDDPEHEAERDFMLPEAERQLFTFTGAKDAPSEKKNDDVVDALAWAVRIFLDEFNDGEDQGTGIGSLPSSPRDPGGGLSGYVSKGRPDFMGGR